MIELEAGQTDTAERFDMAECRFDSIDAGMGRMEAMMEAFLTKNAEDAATYATIAALQQEVTQDMDLAALTSLSSPLTGLARCLCNLAGHIADTLANSGARTLKDLGTDVCRFQGKGSAFAPPALSYSPDLPANVTKCNSTGNPSTCPGMLICHVTANSDASSNLSESDSSILQTQECLEALKSLMKNFNDEIDGEMDDMAQDSDLRVKHELSPPSSPLNNGQKTWMIVLLSLFLSLEINWTQCKLSNSIEILLQFAIALRYSRIPTSQPSQMLFSNSRNDCRCGRSTSQTCQFYSIAPCSRWQQTSSI
jgi:hypothetical protein